MQCAAARVGWPGSLARASETVVVGLNVVDSMEIPFALSNSKKEKAYDAAFLRPRAEHIFLLHWLLLGGPADLARLCRCEAFLS